MPRYCIRWYTHHSPTSAQSEATGEGSRPGVAASGSARSKSRATVAAASVAPKRWCPSRMVCNAANREKLIAHFNAVKGNLVFKFQDITFKHTLLPVWIASYRYNQKVYNFMVNGETGRVQGEAPISWWKVLLTILIVIAIFACIMGVMMLAASKGSTITLHAAGDDEEESIRKLEDLINNRFNEDE